jgi:tRNA A-37 threonylcarbamoyl transferase component Bud32
MMRRLFRAEREILYYMLQKKEAVTFFEDNIETFYNEVYEKIANYIVDYMEKYQKQADVSSLLSEIAASGGSEESDSLSNEITTLAMESNLPPYSEEEIQQCAAVIKEEKGKIYEKRTIDRSLDGKAEEDKVRLINEYAKKVRKRFEKK